MRLQGERFLQVALGHAEARFGRQAGGLQEHEQRVAKSGRDEVVRGLTDHQLVSVPGNPGVHVDGEYIDPDGPVGDPDEAMGPEA